MSEKACVPSAWAAEPGFFSSRLKSYLTFCQKRRANMKRQKRIRLLYLLAGLMVFGGVVLVLMGDMPRPTDILLKATFIPGYFDQSGPPKWVEYKIRNDIDDAYYLNGTANFIVLRNDPVDMRYGGGFFVLDIVTATRSPRYVFMDLDDWTSEPSYPCPTCCTRPYFIFPKRINPIPTSRLLMKSTFGYHPTAEDPEDPGKPVFEQDANLWNFVTMTPGTEEIVALDKHEFQVQNSDVTKNYNDTKDTYWIDFPYYVKVTADPNNVTSNGLANEWIITPIAESFKIYKGLDSDKKPIYADYTGGTIPARIFSNSQQRCLHGVFNLTYELHVTRQ
jgi:hypothetical protein